MASGGNSNEDPDGVMARMFLESVLGLGQLGGAFRTSLRDRGNVPTPLEEDAKLLPGRPRGDNKLWIVDKIIEPQTLPHFFEAISRPDFPDGKTCDLPRPAFQEFLSMSKPYSSWAPAPYNAITGTAMDRMMARIASFEFTSNLLTVSKELSSMKARIWDGVSPLSSRQWVDKGLDRPENYREACQHIGWVIKVFQYLNHHMVAAKMRDTFNNIHDELRTLDEAINAHRRLNGGEPNVKIRDLWTAYMRAHFDYITNSAHTWVMDRINRLRIPIMEDMRNYVSPTPNTMDQRRWELADKIHDLSENTALADINIILPMHGYNGITPFDDSESLYDESSPSIPLSGAHPDPSKRAEQYHLRLRYLTRLIQQGGDSSTAAFLRLFPTLDPHNEAGTMRTVEAQLQAQAQTRAEMRGEQEKMPCFWIADLRRRLSHDKMQWAYVGYRTSYYDDDEKWEKFKKKFEADHMNWGVELGDVEDIRAISKVHWLNTKELGISGDDPNAVKQHFKKYVESGDAPSRVYNDIYLVADQPSIDSYLKPVPEQGGFVLAVDVDFDPADIDRADETPGYHGTLRILTSLLWDDVNPLMLLQTQQLSDLWPLAMYHPLLVYSGPVMPAMRLKWEALYTARRFMFANAEKLREICGINAESS